MRRTMQPASGRSRLGWLSRGRVKAARFNLWVDVLSTGSAWQTAHHRVCELPGLRKRGMAAAVGRAQPLRVGAARGGVAARATQPVARSAAACAHKASRSLRFSRSDAVAGVRAEPLGRHAAVRGQSGVECQFAGVSPAAEDGRAAGLWP